MKKALIALLVLIIIGGGAYYVMKPAPTSAYTVRIGNIPIYPSTLPLRIAQQEGFFDEEGVKVEATQIASSNLIADALFRGDIDITPEISLVPYLTASLVEPGKVKIFSVMDLVTDQPFDAVIVKEDSPINSLEDLVGKKVGVFSGTTATNMLKLLLKQKGVDTSTVQFVQLAPPEQLPALEAGSIDALHAYEPTLSITSNAQSAKPIFMAVYATLLDHSPLGSGLINAQFAAEHPEEAAKVVRALNKAYDFMRLHNDETRAILAKEYKFSSDVADGMFLSYFLHSSAMKTAKVDALIDLFVDSGELKSAPDMKDAYYVLP